MNPQESPSSTPAPTPWEPPKNPLSDTSSSPSTQPASSAQSSDQSQALTPTPTPQGSTYAQSPANSAPPAVSQPAVASTPFNPFQMTSERNNPVNAAAPISSGMTLPSSEYATPSQPDSAFLGATTTGVNQDANGFGQSLAPPPIVPKKSRKKLKALLASAAAVVLLGGGAALAYVVISNTPDMILRDAFYNTTQKLEGSYNASLDYKGSSGDIQISAAGSWNTELISTDISISGEVLSDKKLTAHLIAGGDKAYIKLDNIRELLKESNPAYQETLATYDSLLSKVDSKWVVITESDLEEYFGVSTDDQKSKSECINTALSTYQKDKNQQKEVFDIYQKNQFLTFNKQADDTVEGRSAYHFVVITDEAKANVFAKQIETTAVYKAIKECTKTDDEPDESNSDSDDSSDEPDEAQPKVELWIDKQSRTLRKIQIKDTKESESTSPKDSISVVAVFDYTKPVTISEPKEATTIKELKAGIDELINDAQLTEDVTPIAPVLGIRDFRL